MRIYLREITEDDGHLIVKWRNASSVSSHCLNQKPITLESNLEFYRTKVKTGQYLQYIVERIDEDFGVASYPIATVYLKDIDPTNKRCELCIFTSDDQEWNTESQSIAVKQLLEKAFRELDMHKVYSYVFYEYLDEADLLKRAGFTTEAILKNEAIDSKGNYQDIVRFTIFDNQFVPAEKTDESKQDVSTGSLRPSR